MEIGSLEVGKKADIVVIDMTQPHLKPNWLPVHRLIHQVVGSDVEMVMVDGEFVLLERKPVRVDMSAALEEGNREARALVNRAGIEQHLCDPGWGQLYRRFETRVQLPDLPV